MRKDLPSIYALPIDKDLRNNKELYYSSLKDQETEYKSPGEITKKINEIFARKDFVYKKKVLVKTFDKEEKVNIVGRNNVSLLTLDNQRIPIMNILDIKVIEKEEN